MTRTRAAVFLTVLTCLFLPALAHAQSAIAGVAKDTSGGVLPGVLVEAASPALIEGIKSATTDESGAFRIIDLRPGLYTVTFTLTGFQTVKLESIQLAGEESRTVNAELKLGTVSEVLTVSGAAPVVDITNATRVTSLERTMLDNIPLGNNIWEMAQLIAGINVTDAIGRGTSSVGGINGATQTYMSTHGMGASQNVIMVDGMTVSGLEANGAVQAYFNSDMSSEVSYQTSGIGADRSGGGVTVNMIPREGGNRFSGNGKSNYRPNQWMADNSSRYVSMGLPASRTLRYLSDVTGSQGGPIMRNKLWFFGSFHEFDTSDYGENSFLDSGAQATEDQRIQQPSVRLTWQASPRHKVSGSFEKTYKTIDPNLSSGVDPETAAVRTGSPNYSTGNVKLTSTMTSRLLIEGGYSFNREHRDGLGQPGVEKEFGTPEWYASASRSGGGFRAVAPATFSQDFPGRDNFQGSVSYVTGAHQIKAGVQFQRGTFYHNTWNNASLTQVYDSATLVNFNPVFVTPEEVTVYNTPVSSQDSLKHDIGIYAQDSWRLKRLTVNAGLRWEHVNAQNDAWTAPESRFVPERSIPIVANTPDWYDWAPRFSAVYDLFGDSRTAIKYGINRYNRSAATALAFGFNTLSTSTSTLPWNDKNGDNIAQGGRTFIYNANGTVTPVSCNFASDATCEIDMAGLDPTGGVFGTPSAANQYEGFPRTWNMEQLVEVQHALTRRFSITAAWTRGSDRDLTKSVNSARQEGDYTARTIFNALDGTPFVIYHPKDLATRNRLRAANVTREYVEPLRQSIFHQYSIEFRVRPYAGAQIFGGFSLEREDDIDCATSVAGFVLDPNDLRFCDDTNLPGNGGFDIGGMTPLAKDLRLNASLPLPWYGITFGATYQNNDGGSITPLYSIVPGSGATGTRYPDGLTYEPTIPGNASTGGASRTRLIAGQPAPPCPTTNGCVPGAFVLPVTCATTGTTCAADAFINPGAASTSTVTYTIGAPGRFRRERQNQIDLKFSKTFRVGNFSILPQVDLYNITNEDTIFGYDSATYATSTGTYLRPSSVSQGRIVGVGAQVRW
jgi:hypothetical protein